MASLVSSFRWNHNLQIDDQMDSSAGIQLGRARPKDAGLDGLSLESGFGLVSNAKYHATQTGQYVAIMETRH